jgi:D-psicose/D-tagatose/L-ribulose 3-epimerase
MKISLCNEVIRELSFERQCELVKKLGYDGLEIAPVTLSDDPPKITAARRNELKRIAADNGIAITGLHFLMVAPAGLSITTKDRTVRARSVGVIHALCGLAADLGAKLLIHGSPAQRQLEPGDAAEGKKRGIESFAAAAAAAEKAGVTYLVEPLAPQDTGFVTSVDEAIEIVRAINSPALKTMIDCSAMGRAGFDVPALIRQHLPTGLVAHIHLNDPNCRGPGEGEMKFAPILTALFEMKYAGMASIEPFIYEPDGPTCAARQIGYVRGVIEAVKK